jgi:hypothetical protein
MVLRAYLIFDHVIDDAVGQAPLDKVELGHSRGEALELYPLGPTKGIKEFLGISVKTRLVCHVDRKGAACRGVICHVSILGVVCHEPLEIPKGNPLGLGREDILELFSILWIIVKFCE